MEFCLICKRPFVGKSKFLDHFFASHALPPPISHENIANEAADKSGRLLKLGLKVCTICGEKIKDRDFMIHIKSHIGVLPYYCSICNFPTISELELLQHKSSSHNIFHDLMELHKCNACTSSFKTMFELMNHYMSHLKDLPFCCWHCKVVFLEEIDLIVHSLTHFLTRDCFLCSNTFGKHADVLAHVLTHRKSMYFLKFAIQIGKKFLPIYPQEPCAMQKQKEITVVRVKSVDSLENKIANIAEMQTDPKQGTSNATNGQRRLKQQSSGDILLPFYQGIGKLNTAKESRASGAGSKVFILKTPNAQEIPSDNFKNKNNSKIGISDIFESQTILKPFNASANEKNNHQQSVTESLRPKTSDCIETRINQALTTTDIHESKTIKFAKNECRTVVVENGDDPILNPKFTSADFSTGRREEFGHEVIQDCLKSQKMISKPKIRTNTCSNSLQYLSDNLSFRQNLLKTRRWLFPDAAKSCDINIPESSEDSTSGHLGSEENSEIPHSFEIPQSSYYEDGNTENSLIPFKDSSIKDLTVANASSSTLFEPKIIQCETISKGLDQENEHAPALGSLKETKKRSKSRRARPNCKRSKKPAMGLDEPKTIRNNFSTKRCPTPSNRNFHKNIEKGISRKKANRPRKHTIVETLFQPTPEHYPVNSLRLLELTVKLRPLPEFIYEKYARDKPIMLSSFPPIVEETRCIHHELKRIHQIEEEHCYCVKRARPIPSVV